MNEPSPFSLTPTDRTSGTWMRVLGHMQEELARLRIKNDMPTDEVATAALRGRIAMLKQLIDLDKVEPDIEADKS